MSKRETSSLELVNSNLADFKNYASRSRMNNYIMFVDDCSRFTRVYLKIKDEYSKSIKPRLRLENQLDLIKDI